MAHQPGTQKSGGSPRAAASALVIIRIAAGIYLFFVGLHKVGWLLDSTPLDTRLTAWLSQATPISRWYFERIMPGTPVFARLALFGETIGGLALFLGVWTRLVAGCAFVMVLNYQVASGALFHYAFLSDPGLVFLAVLLGLAIGGGKLPLSLKK